MNYWNCAIALLILLFILRVLPSVRSTREAPAASWCVRDGVVHGEPVDDVLASAFSFSIDGRFVAAIHHCWRASLTPSFTLSSP